MGYARGLVKYSTQNAISQNWSRAQTLRHVLRPRVLVYSFILGAMVIAMLVSLSLRIPFKVDVVRDRGTMARTVAGGKIENVYRLQVMNAMESPQHYKITATGLPGLIVSSDNVVMVGSTESRWIAVRVQAPFDVAAPGSHTMAFEIESLDSPGRLIEKSVFLVPR
jgi:polyferredoxin